MSIIQIKHIEPLTDTGVLELTPVMLFIGKQSTGKSTLMKIICFCRWIEKQVMVGEEDFISRYTHYNRFVKELMKFHRLPKTAFSSSSYIMYDGDCVTITLEGNKNVKIVRKKNFKTHRYNTKLSFIPAERCLTSAINNIDKNYKSSDLDILFNYIMEWNEAREAFTKDNPLDLAFDKQMVYYHDTNGSDMITIKDKGITIGTFYASSGVQSAMPILALVGYALSLVGTGGKKSPMDYIRAISKVLSTNIDEVSNLSNETLNSIRQLLSYKSMQLYIEEPEQNLFPESQVELVYDIVKKIKQAESKTQYPSHLVMTTHSPYVLTSLNHLLAAAKALMVDSTRTFEIIKEEYILPHNYYSAYYINEGCFISLIDDETGLIKGEYLDEVSDKTDDIMYQLNDIIYADVD